MLICNTVDGACLSDSAGRGAGGDRWSAVGAGTMGGECWKSAPLAPPLTKGSPVLRCRRSASLGLYCQRFGGELWTFHNRRGRLGFSTEPVFSEARYLADLVQSFESPDFQALAKGRVRDPLARRPQRAQARGEAVQSEGPQLIRGSMGRFENWDVAEPCSTAYHQNKVRGCRRQASGAVECSIVGMSPVWRARSTAPR